MNRACQQSGGNSLHQESLRASANGAADVAGVEPDGLGLEDAGFPVSPCATLWSRMCNPHHICICMSMDVQRLLRVDMSCGVNADMLSPGSVIEMILSHQTIEMITGSATYQA